MDDPLPLAIPRWFSARNNEKPLTAIQNKVRDEVNRLEAYHLCPIVVDTMTCTSHGDNDAVTLWVTFKKDESGA
jgi:hypothetical protein